MTHIAALMGRVPLGFTSPLASEGNRNPYQSDSTAATLVGLMSRLKTFLSCA